MALFKPFRGSRTALDAQPLHDGYAYFCVDDGSFHIDYEDADGNLQRKQINAKEAESLIGYDISTTLNSSDSEIPTSKAVLDAIEEIGGNLIPIHSGEAEGSIVINEGNATGKSSIAGGTTDKDAVTDLIGTLGASVVTLHPSNAKGTLSMAFGPDNNANTTGSIALGYDNTSGGKGYYFDDINFTNKTITLSTTRRTSSLSSPSYPSAIDWAENDRVYITNGDSKCFLKIAAVHGNTIAVESLPFSKINYESILSVFTYKKPNDRSIINIDKPESGEVDLGFGAVGIGAQNIVLGSNGFTTGYGNKVAGDLGTAFGKNNIVGHAGTAMGVSNEAQGTASVASGYESIATAHSSQANCAGTKATGWGAHATNIYTEAIGEGSFTCGVGTVAKQRGQLVCGTYNNDNGTAKLIVGCGEKGDARNCFATGFEGEKSYIEVGINKLTSEDAGTLREMAANNRSNNQYVRYNDLPVRSGDYIGGLVLRDAGSSTYADYAMALGIGVEARAPGQLVCGTFNQNDGYAKFIVGKGGSADSKSNCFTTGYKDGDGSYLTLGSDIRAKLTAAGLIALNEGRFGTGTTIGDAGRQFVCGQYNGGNWDANFIVGSGAEGALRNCFAAGMVSDPNPPADNPDNKLSAIWVGNTLVTSKDVLDMQSMLEWYRDSYFSTGVNADGDSYIKIGAVELTEYKLKKLLDFIDTIE